MAIYQYASELEHTNLHEWDIVFIAWNKGRVEDTYINFDDSHLWHKATCETFYGIHELARSIYGDTSTIRSTQHFPTFTNTNDSTAIVRELMRRYNGVEPRRGVPMFATEAGPVYDDRASCGAPMSATESAIRAMKEGTSVSYSEKMMTKPVSEKKKSRIVFSKIR